jgi:hypothetical protein
MTDLNRLTVLLNQFDGDYYSLADKLGIDAQLIDNALDDTLNRNQDLELNEALSRYERLELDDYEQAELQDYTDKLNDLEDRLNDYSHIDEMRQAVINDRLTLDEIETMELLVGQGHFTMNIENKIVEYLSNEENSASAFLDLFAADGYRINDIKDSEFWAWYRETFDY